MPWYQKNRRGMTRDSRQTRVEHIPMYNRAARRLPSSGAGAMAGAGALGGSPPRTAVAAASATAPGDRASSTGAPKLGGVRGSLGAMPISSTVGSTVSLTSVPTPPPVGGGGGGVSSSLAAAAASTPRPPSVTPRADPPSSPLPLDGADMERGHDDDVDDDDNDDDNDGDSDDALSDAVTFVHDRSNENGDGVGGDRDVPEPPAPADVPEPPAPADVPSPIRLPGRGVPADRPDRAAGPDDMDLSFRLGSDATGSSHREWHVSDMSEDSLASRLRGGSPDTPPNGAGSAGDAELAAGGRAPRVGPVPLAGGTLDTPRRLRYRGGPAPLTSRDSSQVSVGDAPPAAQAPPPPPSPPPPPLLPRPDVGRAPFRRPTLSPAAAKRRDPPAADRSPASPRGGGRSPASPGRGASNGGGGGSLLTSAGVSLIRKTSAMLHQAALAPTGAPTSPPVDGGSSTEGTTAEALPPGTLPPVKSGRWRQRVGAAAAVRSGRSSSGNSSPVNPSAAGGGVLLAAAGSKRPRGEPAQSSLLPPLYSMPAGVGTGGAPAGEVPSPWPVAHPDEAEAGRRSSVSNASRRSSFDAKTVNSTRVPVAGSGRRPRAPTASDQGSTQRLSLSSSSDGDMPSVKDFRDRPVQLLSLEALTVAASPSSTQSAPTPAPAQPLVAATPVPPLKPLSPLLDGVDSAASRAAPPAGRPDGGVARPPAAPGAPPPPWRRQPRHRGSGRPLRTCGSPPARRRPPSLTATVARIVRRRSRRTPWRPAAP